MLNFDISRRRPGKTFAFSPENPTGTRAGGSKDKPWEKNHPCISVKPGETLTLVDTDGPGRVQSMWIGGDISNNFVIRIYWDNSEVPSVECPLPAFFGYGFPENVQDQEGNFPTLNSAMIMVAPCRGMNCYWPMPFRKHCRITLTNRAPKENRWTYYCITGAGVHPNGFVLLTPLLVLQMACLGLGFGVIVSALTTKYRDLAMLVSFGVQIWMYLTPVTYDICFIPERFLPLYMLNPVTPVITTFRYAFLGTGTFQLTYYLIGWAVTLAVLLLGVVLFNRVEKTFMDTV